jgi:hypothetical protein
MYSQKGTMDKSITFRPSQIVWYNREMNVTEFFSELNNMWEHMDFFDPLTMTCTIDALALVK